MQQACSSKLPANAKKGISFIKNKILNPSVELVNHEVRIRDPFFYSVLCDNISIDSSRNTDNCKFVLNPNAKSFLPSTSALNPLAKSFTGFVVTRDNAFLKSFLSQSDAAAYCAIKCFITAILILSSFILYAISIHVDVNTTFGHSTTPCDEAGISSNLIKPLDGRICKNKSDDTCSIGGIVQVSMMLNPDALSFVPFTERTSDTENLDSNAATPCYTILQNLRIKNVDKIIFGHLNINSVRNKFDVLMDLVKDRIDVLLISETKIDNTFPNAQFKAHGYSLPLRLDRNEYGGGLLFYVRNDIPIKPIPLMFGSIECIISVATISKKKWLILGSYNPNKSQISDHLSILRQNLEHYLPSYDNVLIFGDFNVEPNEVNMIEFCSLFNLSCLIKKPTCFKNPVNPSCIDLILT